MLTHEQNELLTRVDGDAPMGHMMRENYWIPALVSTQLTSDGPPERVRLLGVDYVAFRATDGRVGFIDERCPHRGASMVLARNEDCGLRCIFHGLKVDVSGKVVDAPMHGPNAEAWAAKVNVGHYPVEEAGGIIWVWLGAEEAPPFPHLPFTVLPDEQVWVTITRAECNWFQGVEATLDTAHVGVLHSSYIAGAAMDDRSIKKALDVLAPRYSVERTPYGLDASATRTLPDGSDYLRTTRYVMPFISLVPGSGPVSGTIFIATPIDDEHHNIFWGCWSDTEAINDGVNVPEVMQSAYGNLPYDPHNAGGFTAGRDQNWGQDREAMANGHFSGMLGNLLQEDMVTQVSMGPITDRTKEQLSASDVGIIHARRLLLDAVNRYQEGVTPPGAQRGIDHRDLLPVDTIVDPGASLVPAQ